MVVMRETTPAVRNDVKRIYRLSTKPWNTGFADASVNALLPLTLGVDPSRLLAAVSRDDLRKTAAASTEPALAFRIR